MLSRNSGSALRTLNGNSEYGCALALGVCFAGAFCSGGGGLTGIPIVPGDFGARVATCAAGGFASFAFGVGAATAGDDGCAGVGAGAAGTGATGRGAGVAAAVGGTATTGEAGRGGAAVATCMLGGGVARCPFGARLSPRSALTRRLSRISLIDARVVGSL